MQGKNKYVSREPDILRPHKQPYEANFGAGPDDIAYHGLVWAKSALKARKKARRLQIQNEWPYLWCAEQPSKVIITTESDTGPEQRWSKARRRFEVLVNGRWVSAKS